MKKVWKVVIKDIVLGLKTSLPIVVLLFLIYFSYLLFGETVMLYFISSLGMLTIFWAIGVFKRLNDL